MRSGHQLRKTTVAFLLAASAITSFAGDLPDHRITPGATNPDITQQ